MQDSREQNGRLVLKNTFFEVEEESSPSALAGLMARASSAPELYEGRPRTSSDLCEEAINKAPCDDAMEVEFELTGLSDADVSDTETDPGAGCGRSLHMPCYSHIQEGLRSGSSTPRLEQHGDAGSSCFGPSPGGSPVASTTSLEAKSTVQARQLARQQLTRQSVDDSSEDSPIQSPQNPFDPEPVVSDLDRLAAQVAQLAQENNRLRQQVAEHAALPRQQEINQNRSTGEWVDPMAANCWYGMPFVPLGYLPVSQQPAEQSQPRQWQETASRAAASTSEEVRSSRRHRTSQSSFCQGVVPAGPVGRKADEVKAPHGLQLFQ
ncbi:unnamed protein product, partial [Polarella glacialis]